MTGEGGLNNYATEANLAKRQGLFSYLDPSRSQGRSPIDRIRWRGSERVLDAGCGNGVWMRRLSDRASSLVGVDLSAGMLVDARRTLPAGALLVNGDAQALAFSDESFDVVLCLWMLYHVGDQQVALREFKRVLRPRGVLIAATNSLSPKREDEVLSEALVAATGRTRDSWLPALTFTAENGAEILGHVFGEVEAETTVAAYAVPSSEPLLAAMGSVRDVIEFHTGEALDWEAVEAVARSTIELVIAHEGCFRSEARTASFVAVK